MDGEERAQMQHTTDGRGTPALKNMVMEASQALARLDAARLEELAASCHMLQDRLAARPAGRLAQEASEAARQMVPLGRVLDATRANLRVLQHLQRLRAGVTGYTHGAGQRWTDTESPNGHN